MLIDSAAHAQGATALPLFGSVELGQADSAPPYQRLWHIAFTAPPATTGISVDQAAAVLRGAFDAREWTIAGTQLAQLVSQEDGHLRLQLPGAWWLVGVVLAADRFDAAGHRLRLHRYDGNTAVGEASLDRALSSGSVSFKDAGFVANRVQLRVHKDGIDLPVATSDLQGLTVRTLPAAARLGFAMTDADGTIRGRPNFFHAFPGQVEGAAGSFAVGQAAAKTLDRMLRRVAPVPGPHRLVLVAESDAPCDLHWNTGEADSALALNIVFASEAPLPGGSDGVPGDKRSLRFGGEGRESHSFDLPLPTGVSSARIEVSEHLRGNPPATAITAEPVPAGSQGALLDTGSWTAAPVDRAGAAAFPGVALALLALTARCQLLWRLEGSHEDLPDGAALASGDLVLTAAGQPRWQVLRPTAPLSSTITSLWLVIQAVEGRAVWLGQAGTDTVLRLQRPGSSGRWRRQQGWTDLSLHRHVLQSAKATPSTDGGYQLRCGDQPINREALAAGRASYDLGAAISAWRSSHGPEAPVPLSFASLDQGQLTIYAPQLTIEPA